MMLVNNKFEFGDVLYLKTDKEQSPRQLVAIKACCDGGILYECMCGTSCSMHYDIELTLEKNEVLSL